MRWERREGQEAIFNMEPEPLEVAPPIPIRDRTIPVVDGLISCIVLPPLPANAGDIKTYIQMIQQSVQFGGMQLKILMLTLATSWKFAALSITTEKLKKL